MPAARTDTSGWSNTLAISTGQGGVSAGVVAILAGDASRPWLGRHDENRPWLVRYDESRFWLGRHDESRFWLGRPVMRLRIGGHFVTGFGSGGYYRRIVLMWRRRTGSNTIGTSRSNITRAGSRESTGLNSPVSYTGRSQKQE